MYEQQVTITFYGVARSDANRLVSMAGSVIGDYWDRRTVIDPPATDWCVEGRHTEGAEWVKVYGPWDERNAHLFVSYWNRRCGWDMYRAVPVMTEQEPPQGVLRETGKR